MGDRKRQMRLGVFLMATGHHPAGWRHPGAAADAGVNFEHYASLAKMAEEAKFDLIFLEDGLALRDASPHMPRASHFEPLTLLSALAVITSRIGLVATSSTTYNEPFHVARKFASLDHISGGRAGWNLVTSATEAEALNFSRDAHMGHADRYGRAEEFVDVVTGLWDSWDDDAFPRNKETGTFFEPSKMHPLNHKGRHFSVRGPLHIERPPQGHPVVVQAGSSEPGMELAARTAEIVFTAQQDIAGAQAFYKDLKSRLCKYGRSPDSLQIMPGVSVFIGRTAQEAREKHEQMQALIHPTVGLTILSRFLGVDLSGHPVDEPLPPLPETEYSRSRQGLMMGVARRENLTVRQLYLRVAGARGHWTVVGTAEQVADQLEAWFLEGAADGFNVMPPSFPTGLEEFTSFVVPELQRRGSFRVEYQGSTLRQHLELARPPVRAVQTVRAAPAQ